MTSGATVPRMPEPSANPNAVEIRDLGIRYDLRLTKRTTLKGSLAGMLRRDNSHDNHFWALRHLNLTLAHGESLAVIGPNGAGKSTLLLALAGILQPSEGEIITHGRVSTLLTLGAGFEMDLTGRDNIDLAGAFLGIPQDQMDALTPGHHRVRRHRGLHGRSRQDVLVRDAGAPRVLDRDRHHAGHPAARRSPRAPATRSSARAARRASASWSARPGRSCSSPTT